MGNCIIARNGNVGSADTYSTAEVVVGKWVDGKKIYRKCVLNNYTSSSAVATTSLDTTNMNIDTLVKIEGTVLVGNYRYTIPSAYSNPYYNWYFGVDGDTSTGQYYLRSGKSGDCVLKNCYLFLYYTKTTD